MTKELRNAIGKALIYAGPIPDNEFAAEIWQTLSEEFEKEYPWIEHPSSGCHVYLADIKEASNSESYPMSLVGDEAKLAVQLINQGIDSHLEACFVPDRGDTAEDTSNRFGSRMDFHLSNESLLVFLRRLAEFGYKCGPEDEQGEAADGLLSAILETIDIDDDGSIRPKEDE